MSKNIKQLGEKSIIINPNELQSKKLGPICHLNTTLEKEGHYFLFYSTNELSNSQAEVENGVAYKKKNVYSVCVFGCVEVITFDFYFAIYGVSNAVL